MAQHRTLSIEFKRQVAQKFRKPRGPVPIGQAPQVVPDGPNHLWVGEIPTSRWRPVSSMSL